MFIEICLIWTSINGTYDLNTCRQNIICFQVYKRLLRTTEMLVVEPISKKIMNVLPVQIVTTVDRSSDETDLDMRNLVKLNTFSE
jgi:hypothetical protein